MSEEMGKIITQWLWRKTNDVHFVAEIPVGVVANVERDCMINVSTSFISSKCAYVYISDSKVFELESFFKLKTIEFSETESFVDLVQKPL